MKHIKLPFAQLATFFFWMYLLGVVVAQVTIPHYRGAHIYDNLYTELAFDLLCLCLVLWAVGRRIRPWLKALFYAIAYAVALTDVYVFVTYDTSLTPTVMMLLAETNSREAGEFLQTLFSWNIISGKVGYILLLIIFHILSSLVPKPKFLVAQSAVLGLQKRHFQAAITVLLLGVFLYVGNQSLANKRAVYKLFAAKNIGEVEHLLTEKEHGVMYQPVYRLAFSAYANSLTAQQIVRLKKVNDAVEVDSCTFRTPNIVLIIGESFSRHHSSQYGYWQETTPRQTELEKKGALTKFSDVVSPWNLTSFVFKLMFTTYAVGDRDEWCDHPLFPALFRKAGYHVNFFTNQFLPKAKEAVYDFSGGFFLNDPALSALQFDSRNYSLHQFDETLLSDYDNIAPRGEMKGELTIFQLMGQHVVYAQRSPRNRKKFKKEDYLETKPHLSDRERKILSDYDNAILYNDSVVAAIAQKFDDRDAVVIYVPDHGEECYEGNLHFYCRMHSTEITSRLAHAEFDIPFWIYTSPVFRQRHPDICQQINAAKDKPYMTDALPHLLLYLAGIHTSHYRDELNLLSPAYNAARPRILKNTTDYDKLD